MIISLLFTFVTSAHFSCAIPLDQNNKTGSFFESLKYEDPNQAVILSCTIEAFNNMISNAAPAYLKANLLD